MIGAALRFFRGFKMSHELGVFLALALPFSPILVAISLQKPDEWSQGPKGQAQVIDGDTLVVAGERIDLSRIDAPETDQVCQDASGADYPCGQEAARVLRNFIAARPVECRQRTIDERLVSECHAGEIDLAVAMLRTGNAIYKDRDQIGCRGFESQARKRGIGLWRGRFVDPADWRKGVR